jgi:hypothetical protein
MFIPPLMVHVPPWKEEDLFALWGFRPSDFMRTRLFRGYDELIRALSLS